MVQTQSKTTPRKKLIEVGLPTEAIHAGSAQSAYPFRREPGFGGASVNYSFTELQEVLPAQSRDHIKRLLSKLRRKGQVRLVGERQGARWVTTAEA